MKCAWFAVAAFAALSAALSGCSTNETSGGGGESLGTGAPPSSGHGTTDGASSATGAGGGDSSASTTSSAPTSGPGPSSASATNATNATSTTGSSTASGGPPQFGGSSGGSGGPAPVAGATQHAGGVAYDLVVPASYAGSKTPLLLVYSGTEGHAQMTQNLMSVASFSGTGGFIEAILDGVTYNGDGAAGATVLDALRGAYNIDDDRTYLLGESAGTTAAEQLGLDLRQGYFAAYWANDVNASASPSMTASQLGFAPWGQVGPGGETAIADMIVSGMQAAGYRLPNPAPYAGAGAGTHGDSNQFIAAIEFFPGKTRQ